MNINSMVLKIKNFEECIIASGFMRDVQEFIKTIAQPQNSQNIILLKDITTRVINHLTVIQESDLPDDIKILLPKEDIKPLLPQDHIQTLNELMNDTQVDTSQYYSRLSNELTNLQSQLNVNHKEITTLYDTLSPFYDKGKEISDKAVISFIFKDINTITNLKHFSNILNRWNRTLYIYHQLVSSKKPKDVELVAIQNGSLDVVLNIDFQIAMNFTDIVKYGFIAFNGYLLYKIRSSDIVATYLGNKKLIESEKEREKELLENIGSTISRKLLDQHKSLKKKDKAINSEAVDKKIGEISNVLSEHIVKGNDIKLLVDFPGNDEEASEEVKKNKKLRDDTKKASLLARNDLKKLNADDIRILIEKYTIKDEQS